MKVEVFRKSVANIVIVAVIAVIASITLSSTVIIATTTGKSPIYRVNGGKSVSLMVNVYWGDDYIDDMLRIFSENNVKTTFFVGGSWAIKNENTLKKIYDEGHEIANHGFFHKDHKKISAERNREEILSCHNLVKSILGVNMTLFSPPSASFSTTTLDVAEKLGYTTIMYSRDTIDWRDQNSMKIFNRATANITGGELVLMHPTAATVVALSSIIKEIKSKGLYLTIVSEVLKSEEINSKI